MTARPLVRLDVRTCRSDGAPVRLARTIPMGHLPHEGDLIAVTDEDPAMLIPVAGRRWDFDGQACIILNDIVPNPDPDWWPRRFETGVEVTPRDESVEFRLLASGWMAVDG